jgi:hypothetical protein
MFPAPTNYYKFVVDGGDNLGLGWEQPVSTGGNNRTFVFNPTDDQQILPPVYFSDLSPSEIVVSNTSVTFTVDMTGAVGNEGHVFNSTNDSVDLTGNLLGVVAWRRAARERAADQCAGNRSIYANPDRARGFTAHAGLQLRHQWF